MSEITLIQGDTLEKQIILKNVDVTTIEAVYFSCKELNLCRECIRTGEIFKLEISCEETCQFKTQTCCYDITIKFKGDKIKTIVYRGRIKVLPKVNEVDWH